MATKFYLTIWDSQPVSLAWPVPFHIGGGSAANAAFAGDNQYTYGQGPYGMLATDNLNYTAEYGGVEYQKTGNYQFSGSWGSPSSSTYLIYADHHTSNFCLAAQTIAAGSWACSIFAEETATTVNAFVRLAISVWRPNTTGSGGTLVGYIYDSATNLGTEISTTAGAKTGNVSGSAITVQDGDRLVVSTIGAVVSATAADDGFPEWYRIYSANSAGLNFVTCPTTIAFRETVAQGPTPTSAVVDDVNITLNWPDVAGWTAAGGRFVPHVNYNYDGNNGFIGSEYGEGTGTQNLSASTTQGPHGQDLDFVVYLATNGGTLDYGWGDRASWGRASAPFSITMGPPRPTTYGAAKDSVNGRSQINVTWTNTSSTIYFGTQGQSSQRAAVGYEILRSTDNVNFTSIASTTSGGASSFADTGLSSGTTYYYKLRLTNGLTTNGGGWSRYTASFSATTGDNFPFAPTNLVATGIDQQHHQLTWTDGDTTVTSYELQRAEDSAFTTNPVTFSGLSTATPHSYIDTTVVYPTAYYYRVRGNNSYGAGAWSNVVGPTTPANIIGMYGTDSGTATESVGLTWPTPYIWTGATTSSQLANANILNLYDNATQPAAVTTNTQLIAKSTGWDQIRAKTDATAWAALGAIGAPDGRGWLLDDGSTAALLAGNFQMDAGSVLHAPSLSSSHSPTVNYTFRWYVYNTSTLVYTLIASRAVTGVTGAYSTSANVTWPALQLGANERLYHDIWCQITAAAGNTGATLTANQGSSFNYILMPSIAKVFPFTVSSSDSGTANDSTTSIFIPPTPISGSDSGAATESATSSVSQAQTDARTGAEGTTYTLVMSTADARTATDTQALTPTLTATDTGASTDAGSVIISLSVAGTDVGAGTDSSTLVATTTTSDARTGAEGTPTLAPTVTNSDARTATEGTPTLAPAVAASDSGVESETGLISLQIGGTDVGAVTETTTSVLTVTTSDARTSAETNTGTAAVSTSDAGVEAETGTVLPTIIVTSSDAGVGTDTQGVPQIVEVPIVSSDSGTSAQTHGTILVDADPTADQTGTATDTSTLTATATSPDTGTSADTSTVAASPASSDARTGAEGATYTLGTSAADARTGTDASTLTTAVASTDTGDSTEPEVYTATVTATDSGVETETQSLLIALTLSDSDARTGADSQTLVATATTADTGATADASTLTATLTAPDARTGADTSTLTTAVAGADARTGAEGTYALALSAIDLRTATETGTNYTVNINALPPDVILVETNLSGAVANIQDDPDTADTQWVIATGPVVAVELRTSFPTPPGQGAVLVTGPNQQEFRIRLRLN